MTTSGIGPILKKNTLADVIHEIFHTNLDSFSKSVVSIWADGRWWRHHSRLRNTFFRKKRFCVTFEAPELHIKISEKFQKNTNHFQIDWRFLIDTWFVSAIRVIITENHKKGEKKKKKRKNTTNLVSIFQNWFKNFKPNVALLKSKLSFHPTAQAALITR